MNRWTRITCALALVTIGAIFLQRYLSRTDKEMIFDQISTGMTALQVVEILGEPGDHTGTINSLLISGTPPGCNMDYWLFTERGRSILLVVTYKDGKVVKKDKVVSWLGYIEVGIRRLTNSLT